MWYLIVPPLIFLGSLWLLLWFLSRRSADPAVQGKLEDIREEEAPRRILFIKEETGLKFLEKISQRLRVKFLGLHNSFGSFSESLKKRRASFKKTEDEVPSIADAPTDPLPEEIPVEAPAVLTLPEKKRKFWSRFRKKEGQSEVLDENTFTRHTLGPEVRADSEEVRPDSKDESGRIFAIARKGGERLRRRAQMGDSIVPDEETPVYRRRAPETRERRLVSEEDLIGKIAKNPKDAVAYEELGDYYMESGNLEDAKACYRQVVKLLPMNRPVKDKIRKLERLLTHKGR